MKPRIIHRLLRALLAGHIGWFLAAAAVAASTLPRVENLRAQQRADTKFVDISYDLIYAENNRVDVALLISDDNGVTFNVPVTTVSGDVGADVAVGTGKSIVWDAGADWDGNFTPQGRAKLILTGTPLAFEGFSRLSAASADGSIPATTVTFRQGDSAGTISGSVALPVHNTTLDTFFLKRTEVTFEEWTEVRTWGLGNGYDDIAQGQAGANASGVDLAQHPVVLVSWDDAVKWCNAKSEKDGLTPVYYTSPTHIAENVLRIGAVALPPGNVKWDATGYRLPTEAEWEYTARGGLSDESFPTGDVIDVTQANFDDGTANTVNGTTAVGTYAANGFNMVDMAGNVWEWTWDFSGRYTPGDAVNPRGPDSGPATHIIRGGAWSSRNSEQLNVAFRGQAGPTIRLNSIGFRYARSVFE